MCFHVNQTKVVIADKDIICYKDGFFSKENFCSLIIGFLYERNILYKRNCLRLNEYKRDRLLSKRFHSYITNRSGYLVKFIIPKGSRYLGNHYEYISNQIIWK